MKAAIYTILMISAAVLLVTSLVFFAWALFIPVPGSAEQNTSFLHALILYCLGQFLDSLNTKYFKP